MNENNNNFGNFLNEVTQISEKNSEEQITYIDIDEIESNPKNFYGLRNIDELAGLIAVSHLIEPLTVSKKNNGKYMLISGHRRRAAVQKLLEDGVYTERKLPCIIKNPQKIKIQQENGEEIEFDEDAVEMFNLIASNRGQREERTIDEKLQEIKYLETFAKAIYNQKERKKRGRFLNFFAEEILNISKSQLHRITLLEKLTENVKKAFDNKKISESAAVELSNLTAEEQNDCLKEILQGKITGTAFSIQNWKVFRSFAEVETEKNIDDEEFLHGLQITFRHSRRIFGEDDILEEKTPEEWLEEVTKDFYRKLFEITKRISAEEKDKIKSKNWKNRASLLKKKMK